MKKFILILSCILVLAGCTSSKKDEIKILAPKGATAISLAGLIDNENYQITTVDGTDIITTELVKNESEYDIIIAPVNVGAKLISEGKSQYLLDSVITWGNLYLTRVKDYTQDSCKIAAFGQNAVPQVILTKILAKKDLVCEIDYFNSVADVNANLLAKKYEMGLVAEPAYTALRANAQKKGLEFETFIDLQKEWENGRYPQAALFVKDNNKNYDNFLKNYSDSINKIDEDPKLLEDYIKEDSLEIFGVASASLASSSWQGQNISYVKVKDNLDEINNYLSIFKLSITKENLND